jgi:hypothetical protein
VCERLSLAHSPLFELLYCTFHLLCRIHHRRLIQDAVNEWVNIMKAAATTRIRRH